MEPQLLLQLTFYSPSETENYSMDWFSYFSGDYAGISLPLKLKHTLRLEAIPLLTLGSKRWIFISQN